MDKISDYIITNNLEYLVDASYVFVVVFFVSVFLKIQLSYLSHRFKAISNSYFLSIAIEQFVKIPYFSILLLAAFLATRTINKSELDSGIYDILVAVLIFLLALSLIRYINNIISKTVKEIANRTPDKSAANIFLYFSGISRTLIWILSILFLISNLGYDISTIIAGLGITGIAVALAVKKAAEDIVSSVTIILDKTVSAGDYVQTKDGKGKVIKVGIRSTKIRDESGAVNIIPNSEIASKPLLNFRSRQIANLDYTISFKNQDKFDISKLKKDLEDKLEPFTKKVVSLNLQKLDVEKVVFRLNIKLTFEDTVQPLEEISFDIMNYVFEKLTKEKKGNIEITYN